MSEQLNELHLTLIQIYKKNIDFLNSHHKKVFEKVNKLSIDIETGKHKELYSLEYKEEGYFDIYNNEKKEFLYNHNSYIEAEKRKEMIDFTEKHSLNLLRVDKDNNLSLTETHGDTIPLVHFINNLVDFKNITFSKIYKFIFIGVGLGIHIHEIYKKTNSMNTMIIEPNLEIFRLSLFLVDYSIFQENNKNLFLSIADNKLELDEKISEFSIIHEYMNYNIKHHLFIPEYKYLLDDIIEYYSNNNPLNFPYSSTMDVLKRTIHFMKDKYKFLKKDLINNNKPLKNKKVLLISAGPSLDNHINWIYSNQNKFVIICVDVILKKLEQNSIVPDIVLSIDPNPICGKYLTTEDKNYLKDSAIIFLSQQDKKTIDAVELLNFYFSQVLPISEELGYSVTLPNVGTFSFVISILLGANEIYLTGCDAAFNQETGSRYSKDSSHSKIETTKKTTLSNNISRDDVIEVKGNFRDKILSNRELLEFKYTYETLIHNIEKNYKAYNLSDGAYIEGLTPLKIEDINISEFEKKDINIINELNNISTIVNTLDFGKDKQELNKIIQKVKKFKTKKFKKKDDLMREKIDLMIWIIEQKKTLNTQVFANVFLKFLELADIYFNFVLNIKQENIYKKENLNKLNQYWCDSLLSLLKHMKETIKI